MRFLLSPKGRFTRLQWLVVWFPATLALILGAYFYLGMALTGATNDWITFVMGVICAVLLWASIAATSKRLHDLGRPGFLAIILIAVYAPLGSRWVSAVILLVLIAWLGFWPGDKDDNKYGAAAR